MIEFGDAGGIRVRRHPEPGEHSSSVLERKPKPPGYTNLTYIIHPTAGEGSDRQRLVQTSIQTMLEATDLTTSRAIAIIDPNDSHYLQPGTAVTDIRLDSYEGDWVKSGDVISNVTAVTLIGGNLERCLGAVGQNLISKDGKNVKGVDFQLPLEAIYTKDGITALDSLRYLFAHARNPLEAVAALLSHRPLPNPDYPGNKSFSLIDSYGRYSYDIRFNGKEIGRLTSTSLHASEQHESHPENSGFIIKLSPPLPDPPPLHPIKLSLIGEITAGKEVPVALDESTFTRRLEYARESVLPHYVLSAPE